jgi:hypothetical protein
MADIRRLSTEGHSYDSIAAQIGLSQRQFYRYLSKCYEQDRTILESFPKEEIMNQFTICRDRFEKMRLDLLEKFVYNEKIDDSVRLDAWNLGCEMTIMVTRLSIEGVASLGPDLREIHEKMSRLTTSSAVATSATTTTTAIVR